jgi:hypothetical protein
MWDYSVVKKPVNSFNNACDNYCVVLIASTRDFLYREQSTELMIEVLNENCALYMQFGYVVHSTM